MQLGEKYAAHASSELKSANHAYAANKVIPPSLGTAWCEGATGDGVGEWIELTLKTPMVSDGGFKLEILPGYASSPATYKKNNRPKRLAAIINDDPKTEREITLEDYAKFQSFIFDETDEPVNTIRLRILEVYKGGQYSDTCITDISLWKWPNEKGGNYLGEWHAWMDAQPEIFKGVKWKNPDRDSMSVIVGYTESRFYSPDGGESGFDTFLDAFMRNPALFLTVLDMQSDDVVKNVTYALLNPINETYSDSQIRAAIDKGLSQLDPAARARLAPLLAAPPASEAGQ